MRLQKSAMATVIMLIVLTMTSGVMARGFAGSPTPLHTGERGLAALKLFVDLRLSDEQRDRVVGIIEEYRDDMKDLRQNLNDAERKLMATMNEDEFNEQSVRQAYQRVSAIRGDLLVLGGKVKAELRNILTPEQAELLKVKKAKRGDLIGSWLDRRCGGCEQ